MTDAQCPTVNKSAYWNNLLRFAEDNRIAQATLISQNGNETQANVAGVKVENDTLTYNGQTYLQMVLQPAACNGLKLEERYTVSTVPSKDVPQFMTPKENLNDHHCMRVSYQEGQGQAMDMRLNTRTCVLTPTTGQGEVLGVYTVSLYLPPHRLFGYTKGSTSGYVVSTNDGHRLYFEESGKPTQVEEPMEVREVDTPVQTWLSLAAQGIYVIPPPMTETPPEGARVLTYKPEDVIRNYVVKNANAVEKDGDAVHSWWISGAVKHVDNEIELTEQGLESKAKVPVRIEIKRQGAKSEARVPDIGDVEPGDMYETINQPFVYFCGNWWNTRDGTVYTSSVPSGQPGQQVVPQSVSPVDQAVQPVMQSDQSGQQEVPPSVSTTPDHNGEVPPTAQPMVEQSVSNQTVEERPPTGGDGGGRVGGSGDGGGGVGGGRVGGGRVGGGRVGGGVGGGGGGGGEPTEPKVLNEVKEFSKRDVWKLAYPKSFADMVTAKQFITTMNETGDIRIQIIRMNNELKAAYGTHTTYTEELNKATKFLARANKMADLVLALGNQDLRGSAESVKTDEGDEKFATFKLDMWFYAAQLRNQCIALVTRLDNPHANVSAPDTHANLQEVIKTLGVGEWTTLRDHMTEVRHNFSAVVPYEVNENGQVKIQYGDLMNWYDQALQSNIAYVTKKFQEALGKMPYAQGIIDAAKQDPVQYRPLLLALGEDVGPGQRPWTTVHPQPHTQAQSAAPGATPAAGAGAASAPPAAPPPEPAAPQAPGATQTAAPAAAAAAAPAAQSQQQQQAPTENDIKVKEKELQDLQSGITSDEQRTLMQSLATLKKNIHAPNAIAIWNSVQNKFKEIKEQLSSATAGAAVATPEVATPAAEAVATPEGATKTAEAEATPAAGAGAAPVAGAGAAPVPGAAGAEATPVAGATQAAELRANAAAAAERRRQGAAPSAPAADAAPAVTAADAAAAAAAAAAADAADAAAPTTAPETDTVTVQEIEAAMDSGNDQTGTTVMNDQYVESVNDKSDKFFTYLTTKPRDEDKDKEFASTDGDGDLSENDQIIAAAALRVENMPQENEAEANQRQNALTRILAIRSGASYGIEHNGTVTLTDDDKAKIFDKGMINYQKFAASAAAPVATPAPVAPQAPVPASAPQAPVATPAPVPTSAPQAPVLASAPQAAVPVSAPQAPVPPSVVTDVNNKYNTKFNAESLNSFVVKAIRTAISTGLLKSEEGAKILYDAARGLTLTVFDAVYALARDHPAQFWPAFGLLGFVTWKIPDFLSRIGITSLPSTVFGILKSVFTGYIKAGGGLVAMGSSRPRLALLLSTCLVVAVAYKNVEYFKKLKHAWSIKNPTEFRKVMLQRVTEQAARTLVGQPAAAAIRVLGWFFRNPDLSERLLQTAHCLQPRQVIQAKPLTAAVRNDPQAEIQIHENQSCISSEECPKRGGELSCNEGEGCSEGDPRMRKNNLTQRPKYCFIDQPIQKT